MRLVSKWRSKLRSKSVSGLVSRSIFKLRKYKLNYLFKYLKSMAESGSIIITEPMQIQVIVFSDRCGQTPVRDIMPSENWLEAERAETR